MVNVKRGSSGGVARTADCRAPIGNDDWSKRKDEW